MIPMKRVLWLTSLCLFLAAGLLPNLPAWASSNPALYRLDWPVRGETLSYRSCGCADSCWTAELRHNSRPRALKARLRCDCETLHFLANAQASSQGTEVAVGSCSPINESGDKFALIPQEMAMRLGVTLPWPQTASAVIGRAEHCRHLAGEFGGDQSARDREINQALRTLACDKAVPTLKALRARLPKGDVKGDAQGSAVDALLRDLN